MSTQAPIGPEPDTAISRSADVIERMWTFAEKICKAKFISKAAQGDPASTFFLISTSQDLGMKWTHGLRSLYMTPDGKVGLQGDVMQALLLGHGFKVEFPNTDKTSATCHITRPDGQDYSWTFTMADAANIKRYDYDTKTWKSLSAKFNYVNYPQNMLMWRALSNCARFIAADLLGGIYLPDELEDIAHPQLATEEEAGPLAGKVGVKALPAGTEPAEPESKPPETETEPPTTETPTVRSADEVKVTQSEETKPLTLTERKAAIIDDLGILDKAGNSLIRDYCRGYLASDALPKKEEVYGPILDKLEADIKDPGRRKVVLGRPKTAGGLASGRSQDAIDVLASSRSWDADVVQSLRSIAKNNELTPEDAIAWLNAVGADALNSSDAAAFLAVAALSRKAYRVLDAVRKFKQHNLSVAALVSSMESAFGKPLQDVDKPELDKALDSLDQLLGEKYGQPAATEPEQGEMPF